MQPTMETEGTQTQRGWRDKDGFVGPMQPGKGPRSDPRGDFPTGPDVGEQFPEVQCLTAAAEPFSFDASLAGQPTVFIFYRSAVW